jgi:hypothetical protein
MRKSSPAAFPNQSVLFDFLNDHENPFLASYLAASERAIQAGKPAASYQSELLKRIAKYQCVVSLSLFFFFPPYPVGPLFFFFIAEAHTIAAYHFSHLPNPTVEQMEMATRSPVGAAT